jgi:hypothetical protein
MRKNLSVFEMAVRLFFLDFNSWYQSSHPYCLLDTVRQYFGLLELSMALFSYLNLCAIIDGWKH